jgi:hypothetical protein
MGTWLASSLQVLWRPSHFRSPNGTAASFSPSDVNG